jgi:hypothetical protein
MIQHQRRKSACSHPHNSPETEVWNGKTRRAMIHFELANTRRIVLVPVGLTSYKAVSLRLMLFLFRLGSHHRHMLCYVSNDIVNFGMLLCLFIATTVHVRAEVLVYNPNLLFLCVSPFSFVNLFQIPAAAPLMMFNSHDLHVSAEKAPAPLCW